MSITKGCISETLVQGVCLDCQPILQLAVVRNLENLDTPFTTRAAQKGELEMR
jgi:hypothetical protein